MTAKSPNSDEASNLTNAAPGAKLMVDVHRTNDEVDTWMGIFFLYS